MKICRFYLPDQGVRLGQLIGQSIYDLTATGFPHFSSLTALLQASATTAIEALLQAVDSSALPSYAYA
ncbi:MAG: hypothetical protein QHJ74_13305, partial [Anaerolineae bacterium]|nr:hypothetical protein [Anaerolineae bacterium]